MPPRPLLEAARARDAGLPMMYEGARVTQGARPARLEYESLLVRTARRMLKLAFVLVGLCDETQTLRVRVMDNFVDDGAAPVRAAYVSVSDARLEVVQAELQFEANLQGVYYFMYHWFLSASVVGITFTSVSLGFGILVALGTVVALVLSRTVRRFLIPGLARLVALAATVAISVSLLTSPLTILSIASAIAVALLDIVVFFVLQMGDGDDDDAAAAAASHQPPSHWGRPDYPPRVDLLADAVQNDPNLVFVP